MASELPDEIIRRSREKRQFRFGGRPTVKWKGGRWFANWHAEGGENKWCGIILKQRQRF